MPPSAKKAKRSSTSLSAPTTVATPTSPTYSVFSPSATLLALLSPISNRHRLRVYNVASGASLAEHVLDAANLGHVSCAPAFAARPPPSDQDNGSDALPARTLSEHFKQLNNLARDADAVATKAAYGVTSGGAYADVLVLVGTSSGQLLVFSPALGQPSRIVPAPAKDASAITGVVSGRPGQAYVLHASGRIVLLDLDSGEQVLDLAGGVDKHAAGAESKLAWEPSAEEGEAERLAVSVGTKAVLFSRSSSSTALQKAGDIPGHASSLIALSLSPLATAASEDRIANVWSLPSPTSCSAITHSLPLSGPARALFASTDGALLGGVTAAGDVEIFDLKAAKAGTHAKGGKVRTLKPAASMEVASEKDKDRVVEAAFVRGGEAVVVVRLEGGVKPVFDSITIRDPSTQSLILTLSLPTASTITTTTTSPSSLPTSRALPAQTHASSLPTSLPQSAAPAQESGDLEPSLAELSLNQRLKASASSNIFDLLTTSTSTSAPASSADPTTSQAQPTPTIPATSLATLLTQALHSADATLLETCLSHTDPALIRNTIARLPSQLAVPLLLACVERLSKPGKAGAGRARGLVEWVRGTLGCHTAHLLSVPDLHPRLISLHSTLTQRLSSHSALLSLSGRLDLVLSQIALQRSLTTTSAPAAPAPSSAKKGKKKGGKHAQPQGVRYVEGDSDVEVEYGAGEGEVEDVELRGEGSEMDEDEEDEEGDEEFGGSEDEEEPEEDEEEDESDEDEESDEEVVGGGRRPNGFVDDEAEEGSDEEDE